MCFALVSGGWCAEANRHLLGFRGTKCAFWAFSLDIILIMINNNNNISFIASHLVRARSSYGYAHFAECISCLQVHRYATEYVVAGRRRKLTLIHSIAQLQLQFTVYIHFTRSYITGIFLWNS